MAYEQRLGSTNLFKNRNKGTNPKAPDYTAKVDVQYGDEIISLDIAGWQRHSDKAGDFLSLSVKTTGVKPNRDLEQAGMGQQADNNEEIPF